MKLRSIGDADVAGKRVLLRMSLNVPVAEDGSVGDLYRLRRGLPTLRRLVEQGASVIIVGYFGRAGESLRPVAEALMHLAPEITMHFFPGSILEAQLQSQALKSGECLILENIRREPGEEKNEPALAAILASLCDIFVDDAFAEAHRPYASNVGVTALRPSMAGLLMEEEVERLSEALKPPQGSLAIIGGAKFETKEPLIKKLLPLYAEVCVGGALSNDFLKARGLSVGASKVSDRPVPVELANHPQILIENDMIVVGANGTRTVRSNDIHADERIVDAGPETSAAWSEKIGKAPLVLWNGPLGVYEADHRAATDALAEALAGGSARGVVGGGDTIAALEQFSFDEKRIFRSTGGGAMLQFLAEGTLPALAPLIITD